MAFRNSGLYIYIYGCAMLVGSCLGGGMGWVSSSVLAIPIPFYKGRESAQKTWSALLELRCQVAFHTKPEWSTSRNPCILSLEDPN